MKKCPRCKRTYDASWDVCLYCREELAPAEEIAGEYYLGDLVSPRDRFLIVMYSLLLILMTPLLILLIYITYFSNLELGFRKSEEGQLRQAIYFEEEEEKKKADK
ncbi:MAG: hypothetical protein GF409_04275 [Candidatus Omnitrophica bacterium]|nr:hypothetical protein [Candidatus Omnitrophota bacterium]